MAKLVVAVVLVSLARCIAAQNDAKVLIVGAGMTGTMAGKTLHESGMEDFIILESSSRVGGRMWNVPFGGITVELGAMWMQGGGPNNPIFRRATDIGMEFRSARYSSLIFRDDHGSDVTAEADEVYEYFEPVLEAVDFYCLYMQCERPDKPDTSVSRNYAMFGWEPKTPVEQAINSYEIEFKIAQFPDGSSSRHFYAWGSGGDFDAFDYTVTDSRGYAYVVQSFMDDFMQQKDKRLRLNQHATEISQNATHVTVTTSDGQTYTGEYLLNTVSLGVLQSKQISFDPPFSGAKVEAIMQHKMTTYLTAYLKFDEALPAFWDQEEWIVFAGPRRRYWPIWQNFNSFHPGCNILQALVTGDEAQRVERLSDAEVQAELMGVLRSMYGPDIPAPNSILVPRWGVLSNFMGSYSDWPTGYNDELLHALREPHGRVHFAGEAMSSRYFGYTHGAHFEGIRGAEFLQGCMDGGDCKMPIVNECLANNEWKMRNIKLSKKKKVQPDQDL